MSTVVYDNHKIRGHMLSQTVFKNYYEFTDSLLKYQTPIYSYYFLFDHTFSSDNLAKVKTVSSSKDYWAKVILFLAIANLSLTITHLPGYQSLFKPSTISTPSISTVVSSSPRPLAIPEITTYLPRTAADSKTPTEAQEFTQTPRDKSSSEFISSPISNSVPLVKQKTAEYRVTLAENNFPLSTDTTSKLSTTFSETEFSDMTEVSTKSTNAPSTVSSTNEPNNLTENRTSTRHGNTSKRPSPTTILKEIACISNLDSEKLNLASYNTMTMECTAFTHTGNKTATGIMPRRGVIAVDPRVIPLGSQLYVEGYGLGVAADTGGVIKGKRIDIFLESKSECLEWGRRKVTVYLLRTGV